MTWSSHTDRRYRLFFFTFMVLSTLLTASLALASTPPSYDRLAPISAQVQSPTGLALDQHGRVYVAETSNNRITIYSQSGRFLRTINDQQGPVSIAVGADGRIYIGNKNTGNVSVYSGNSSFLFKLGRGNGEFGFPSAIAVDNTTNRIYVADRKASAVQAFNADGSFNATIGQPGNGDGQFHKPVSLAIDATAGELIVLDQQQRTDTFYRTLINGARIQYFDLNGNFLRGYSKFGYDIGAGEIAQPIHIAVDSTSRVYVTDSSRQKVLVYDNSNTFLGLIDDNTHPLRTPLGLAIGKSNRLYTSSFIAGQVEVYGVDDYSAMEVTPSTLSFQAVEGGANPASKSTTINNNGKTGFNWTADSQDSKIILADTTGALLAPGSRTFEVGMDTQGLAPGIYTSSIDITVNETEARETVSVTLRVLENPLQVNPSTLIFNAEAGTTPTGQTLTVSTSSINPMNWTASADQDWLSISRTSGSTTEDIRVYVAPENMVADTYTGTITFTNLTGDPAPVKVAVTLNLTDPGDTPIDPPGTTPPGGNGDNRKWTLTQVQPGTSLNGVWGSSPMDIFVVGDQGTILHQNGKKWKAMDSGSSDTLYSVWGSSDDDIYAVGDSGLVLHYDGNDWAPLVVASQETLHDVIGTETDVLAVDTYGSILSDSLASSTASGIALRSIWGSSDADIYVTGEAGTVLHYDGTSWDSMDSDTTQWLHAVWGSSGTDVFAVGENGAIIHFDGTIWSAMDSGTNETLLSVWGKSGTDVFAVGSSGLILHYNGSGWYPVASGATVTLNDVWVSSKSEVYAVGEDGIIVSGKSKFQWMHFITTVIMPNAIRNNGEDDEKTEKGLIPTTIIEGDK